MRQARNQYKQKLFCTKNGKKARVKRNTQIAGQYLRLSSNMFGPNGQAYYRNSLESLFLLGRGDGVGLGPNFVLLDDNRFVYHLEIYYFYYTRSPRQAYVF